MLPERAGNTSSESELRPVLARKEARHARVQSAPHLIANSGGDSRHRAIGSYRQTVGRRRN